MRILRQSVSPCSSYSCCQPRVQFLENRGQRIAEQLIRLAKVAESIEGDVGEVKAVDREAAGDAVFAGPSNSLWSFQLATNGARFKTCEGFVPLVRYRAESHG